MWRQAFQGMGGAMMVPVGRLVILRAVPKAGLVRALAFLTVPSLVGPMYFSVFVFFCTANPDRDAFSGTFAIHDDFKGQFF